MAQSHILDLLLDVQANIHRLGTSQKTRWGKFCLEPVMTVQHFQKRMQDLFQRDIPLGDIRDIWRATGITGDTMQFPNFMKFMTTEDIDPDAFPEENVHAYNPPEPQPQRHVQHQYDEPAPPPRRSDPQPRDQPSLYTVLQMNRDSIIHRFLQFDRFVTGRVSTADFADMCYEYDSHQNSSSINEVCRRYRTQNDQIDYFLLMSDLCHESPPDSLPYEGGSRQPIARDHDSRIPIRQQRSVDDNRLYDAPPPARPQMPPAMSRPMPADNEIVGVIHEIASQLSRVPSSNKQIFTKWRGGNDLLDAEHLVIGVKKEFGMDMSSDIADAIINRYNGPMNLSAFVRMLTEGQEALEPLKQQQSDMADDAILARVVSAIRNVNGNRWEDIIQDTAAIEDTTRLLRRLGAVVDENDLRNLQGKWGKLKLINTIRSRL